MYSETVKHCFAIFICREIKPQFNRFDYVAMIDNSLSAV